MLQRKSDTRDLGTIHDSILTFHDHYKPVIDKVNPNAWFRNEERYRLSIPDVPGRNLIIASALNSRV